MKTKGIKKLICLTLSLLMISACFAALPANAYVSTSTEELPNTINAPVIKSNIIAWDGKTTVGVNEDGCYEFVADGTQNWPNITIKVPSVDASVYTNIVLEISGTLDTADAVRTYCRADYSTATDVAKSTDSPKSSDGWKQVTLSYAPVDDTITQLRFQPWGELVTPEAGTTFYIRSIKFVKSTASDMVYPVTNLWSTNNASIDYSATKDGVTCTKVSPTNVGDWTAINPLYNNGYNVDLNAYNYCIIDMFYENVDNTSNIIYPMILLKHGATQYAASGATVAAISGTLYPMTENSGYDGSANTNRQTFTEGQWGTYVFPLDQYSGYDFETNNINCLAYWQIKFTDSGGDHNFNVYIKSIRFTAEAPQKENTTITPALSGGVTTSNVGNTVHATTVYDDKLVWQVGGETAKSGSVQFSNVNIPVAPYNYVLVNCYYTGSAGGSYPIVRIVNSKNGGISGWYSLYSHDGGVAASQYSTSTRLSVGNYGGSGKWITLVFPIVDKNIISESASFNGTDYITSFCVDLHGNGGQGDSVYVSSVTFSATPVPVVDEKVDDEIIFRGAQDGLNPTDTHNDFRFIATMGDLQLDNYSAVGFDVVRSSDKATLPLIEGRSVYRSILASTDSGLSEITAETWNDTYIVALELKGVPVRNEAIELVVTPYLKDSNGNKISGMSAKVTIVNGQITAWTLEVAS